MQIMLIGLHAEDEKKIKSSIKGLFLENLKISSLKRFSKNLINKFNMDQKGISLILVVGQKGIRGKILENLTLDDCFSQF